MSALKIYSAIYDTRNTHPVTGVVLSRVIRLLGAEETDERPRRWFTPLSIRGSRRAPPGTLTTTINGEAVTVSLGDVAHAQRVILYSMTIDAEDFDLSPLADELAALGVDSTSVDAWLVDARAVLARDAAEPAPAYDAAPVTLTFRSHAVPAPSYVPFAPPVTEQRRWYWRLWG